MRRPTLHRYENLESRLAMAGLVAFTDVDGDIVTVQTNRGTDALLSAALILSPRGTVGGFQLERVQLDNPAFARTNLTITARPGPLGGDDVVNLGDIVTSLDLGRVTIGGDIGRIRAGDSNLRTSGVAAFNASSVGLYGTGTGASDTYSFIVGGLPSFRLDWSLYRARFSVTGQAANVVIGGNIDGANSFDGFEAYSIGRIVVGGSVRGDALEGSGRIVASRGNINRVEVAGDLEGGFGNNSGSVASTGTIGFARVGRSIIGGGTGPGGNSSGSITAGRDITRLVVGGQIAGGGGALYSGAVYAVGAIRSAVVGGAVSGGVGFASGIITAGSIGTLDIGGAIQGGVGTGSGFVSASGRIGTLRVGGIGAGDGVQSGSVQAQSLGTVLVRGNVLGSWLQPAIISAEGSTRGGPRAIGSLTVAGNMIKTLVLAGYRGTSPRNAAARIGTVTVGGSMQSSSIVAGIENPGPSHPSGMPQFGDGFDVPIAGRGGSRIDSLVVNGTALGDADPTLYSGVLANSIGSVRLGGVRHTPTRAGIAPTSGNLVFRLIP